MVQQNPTLRHCLTQIDYPVKSQKPQCHDLKQFHMCHQNQTSCPTGLEPGFQSLSHQHYFHL